MAYSDCIHRLLKLTESCGFVSQSLLFYDVSSYQNILINLT